MLQTTVIQHEPFEGAGTLARLLPGHRLVRTFAGEQVPDDAQALVVLGGGMGVSDLERLPHLRDEIQLLQRCVGSGAPVLGICLGSQLLAAALGGSVQRAKAKEIGFYRVRMAAEARDDALFAGAPSSFVAFHWHGDAFALPPLAVPLASSTMTPLQAFRAGARAWGVQFHLETDAQVLQAMVEGGAAELSEAGVEPELLAAQAQRELPRLQQIAAGVFSRFAEICR
jgi:GMP synthase (glutamine-hydrolysing)